MRRVNLTHVLCPIDFSSLTPGSLAAASAIARARHAELRALHVMSSDGLAPGQSPGALERQTLMSQLRASLDEAAPAYDRTGAAIRRGDPASQILRFARALPADLIVMGAPGADRPERPAGPVTSVVVTRSDCPVLTVPTHHMPWANESGLFSRIVCAVDLAPSSRSVVDQALALAWETHAHLTYVCVFPDSASGDHLGARARLLEAIPVEAHDWCVVEILVSTGSVGGEIVRVAESANADLVVIGPPRRWTSAAHAVLGRSLCPVLVTHDVRPLRRPRATTRPAQSGLHGEERRS